EAAPRRLRLRERRLTRGARRLRRRGRRGALSVLLGRIFPAAAVLAAALGAFTYLQRTEPPWWARLWYPLKYATIVRGHAGHYRLNPALLAAVIEQESKYNANARSSTGAIGL